MSLVVKTLIVDNEPGILKLAEQLLSVYPQLKIFKALSGEEAMEIIHKEKPEIILLDLKLGEYPAIDGMTVLERLRKFDQKTEVIVMTAIRDESFIIGAKKLGARAYLKKLFPFKMLDVEIAQILQERTRRYYDQNPSA